MAGDRFRHKIDKFKTKTKDLIRFAPKARETPPNPRPQPQPQPRAHRPLIFSVAFGQFDQLLAGMMVTSLRKIGYKGDLVVFVDKDITIDGASCINVTLHPNGNHLRTGLRLHNNRQRGPFDYLLMRTCPQLFIDLSIYDCLLYCDSDMLFYNLDFGTFFETDRIWSQRDCRNLDEDAAHVPRLYKQDSSPGAGVPGACAGFVFVPARYFGLFNEWSRIYRDANQQIHTNDQQVLNYLLLTKKYEFNLIPWSPKAERPCMDVDLKQKETSFAVHYWCGHQWNMADDFNKYYKCDVTKETAWISWGHRRSML